MELDADHAVLHAFRSLVLGVRLDAERRTKTGIGTRGQGVIQKLTPIYSGSWSVPIQKRERESETGFMNCIYRPPYAPVFAWSTKARVNNHPAPIAGLRNARRPTGA